jgi:hypothetical protein
MPGAAELSESAYRCCTEALAVDRDEEKRDVFDFANALRAAALLKEQQGDRSLARALFAEARDHYRIAGIDAGVVECSTHLARLG